MPSRLPGGAVLPSTSTRSTKKLKVIQRPDQALKLFVKFLDMVLDMVDEEKKGAVFEAITVMGKALASPRRLEILDLLAQGPRTVDELAHATRQSTANTS